MEGHNYNIMYERGTKRLSVLRKDCCCCFNRFRKNTLSFSQMSSLIRVYFPRKAKKLCVPQFELPSSILKTAHRRIAQSEPEHLMVESEFQERGGSGIELGSKAY